MTKKIYILLIAFGFFMIPNAIFACNSHVQTSASNTELSEKEGCAKGFDSKTTKRSCCDKKSATDKSDNGCKGKCGHGSCTVSIIQFALISPLTNDLSVAKDFYFSNKINFTYLKTDISSGFYSLWLIPKIG